jgi:hypothetical protein
MMEYGTGDENETPSSRENKKPSSGRTVYEGVFSREDTIIHPKYTGQLVLEHEKKQSTS